MEFTYEHDGETYKIEIVRSKDGFVVKHDNNTYSLMDVHEGAEGLYKFHLNRQQYKSRVAASGELRHVFLGGKVFQLKKVSKRSKSKSKSKSGSDEAQSGQIQSPINGKIIKLRVSENSTVTAEQDLIIIEAMKMEHRIKSPFAGAVTKIHVKEGEQVELGALLVELEPAKPSLKPESE